MSDADQSCPPVAESNGLLKIECWQEEAVETQKMADRAICSIAVTVCVVDLVGRCGRVRVGRLLGLLGGCGLLLACRRAPGLKLVGPEVLGGLVQSGLVRHAWCECSGRSSRLVFGLVVGFAAHLVGESGSKSEQLPTETCGGRTGLIDWCPSRTVFVGIAAGDSLCYSPVLKVLERDQTETLCRTARVRYKAGCVQSQRHTRVQ